ncbi:hypothetical protein H6G74_13125 [Nostoc spongiaeforme FACHB-130]|uniref:DUF5666 domain-containing protein n=1 Tax=Nostoc spongiaeforme FACHB-130 TaxID=1357510 RepID=A0ABR8FV05_9NOSO|nr:hypothetical protein [Nostoc spongiaeforme]MBD2595264.1 hypothetical protein [Nostoc spongiaeforme FACHB-130]
MTASLKVMFAGVLAAGTLLAGYTISAIAKEVKTGNLLLAQTPAKSKFVELPIALPNLAKISLKGGESQSGKIIQVDAQKQTLKIQRSSDTLSISLNKIDKVQFDNKALVYRSDGRRIIRGEQKHHTAKQVTLNGLPLNTFTIQNSATGTAKVKLAPPVVSRGELLGIQAVAEDRQYVVDQMQFNPQKRTMTIQATPY